MHLKYMHSHIFLHCFHVNNVTEGRYAWALTCAPIGFQVIWIQLAAVVPIDGFFIYI